LPVASLHLDADSTGAAHEEQIQLCALMRCPEVSVIHLQRLQNLLNDPEKTDSLNAIGVYSTFHEQYGYYADPVDDKTATLPKGWRARLVNLPPGDTDGVLGLCLDPHDLAIAKYVAAREKDFQFNRKLVSRGLLDRDKLLHLLQVTPINDTQRAKIAASIELDYSSDVPFEALIKGRRITLSVVLRLLLMRLHASAETRRGLLSR